MSAISSARLVPRRTASDMVEHDFHRDGQSRVIAQFGHAQRVADEGDVHAGLIHQAGERVIVGRYHDDFFAPAFFSRQVRHRDFIRWAAVHLNRIIGVKQLFVKENSVYSAPVGTTADFKRSDMGVEAGIRMRKETGWTRFAVALVLAWQLLGRSLAAPADLVTTRANAPQIGVTLGIDRAAYVVSGSGKPMVIHATLTLFNRSSVAADHP